MIFREIVVFKYYVIDIYEFMIVVFILRLERILRVFLDRVLVRFSLMVVVDLVLVIFFRLFILLLWLLVLVVGGLILIDVLFKSK